MNFNPLINGVEFSWSSITVTILGIPVAGITALSYQYGQEKSNIFGSGSNVVARTQNNRIPEASITLLTKEVFAIVKAAPQNDLTKVPMFDITVSYLNNAGSQQHDVIKNCEFTTNIISSQQNNDSIPIELPLVCSHIEYNKTI